ncbi:hypothetical protein [Planobispora takensis]|uniref:Uncharacterized protein n=1 Tax=Planobispora takensis TaxID=1367882 RepID=A0A8J3T280_9ACTN|nr:hypothetical protein [Planobispora takensis]GII04408.1 hypothetical protein Pta02_64160 [Planobispora takensis]
MLITLIVIGAIAWGVKKLFFDEPEARAYDRPVHQAARTLVSVTLQAIRDWLGRHSDAAYADIIRRHLADGQVNVVTIGLTAHGRQVAHTTWTGPVGADLRSAFGTAHSFRLHT